MPPHHTPGNIYPFSRPVDAPGPQIARIMGDRPDLYDQLEQPRRGLLDRIADALGTERGFAFFLGFYSGVMFCCGTLILWAKVL